MAKCISEVDSNLPCLNAGQPAYPVSLAEASLPFLRNCIKENFRVTPVFTMPLARRVMNDEGIEVSGQHVPKGVSTTSRTTQLWQPNELNIALDFHRRVQPCVPS
jgi:hypothetical protein